MQSKNKLLIVADSEDESKVVSVLLEKMYANIKISLIPESYILDFDEWQPEIVILAFKKIESTIRFCMLLKQLSKTLHDHNRHKIISLCQYQDIDLAYKLCRANKLYDYVPFWPMAHDNNRLLMSVINSLKLVSMEINQNEQVVNFDGILNNKESKDVEKLPLVMLVDDEKFQHKIVGHYLNEINCKIESVYSALDTISKLKECMPKLILMDVVMPDISGIDLIYKIKDTFGDFKIPIVMVTGNSDADVVQQSIEAGAAGFLVKPFSKKTFEDKVLNYLQ